jgi:hypothetical protein
MRQRIQGQATTKAETDSSASLRNDNKKQATAKAYRAGNRKGFAGTPKACREGWEFLTK